MTETDAQPGMTETDAQPKLLHDQNDYHPYCNKMSKFITLKQNINQSKIKNLCKIFTQYWHKQGLYNIQKDKFYFVNVRYNLSTQKSQLAHPKS